METIHLRNGVQRMEGTLVLPKANQEVGAAVVLVHGLGSSQKGYIEIAQRLVGIGVSALVIDLRGHGKHEGDLSVLGLDDAIDDGLVAHDYLVGRGVADRIGFGGASLGGLVSTMVAAQRPIESLVLRAPVTYPQRVREMSFANILNTQGHLFNEIEDIASTCGILAVRKFRGSLLVVVSGEDEIIPRRICEVYLESAVNAKSKESVIIDGAKHVLEVNSPHRKIFIDQTVERFASTLSV